METYGDLLTDIASWLARDDLTAKIPTFVRLAQSDICADLRVRVQEAETTYSVSGSPVALPTNFLGIRSIHLDVATGSRALTYMTPERLETSLVSTEAGNPSAYTVFGTQIIFAPAGLSGAPVNVVLKYIGSFDDLDDTTDTNTVLDKFYDVYLYASLKHAFSYIRDDEQAAKYSSAYSVKVDQINMNANYESRGVKLIRTGGFTP